MATRAGSFRWTICALLFFATTVNYADRQILGMLAPVLEKEIGWSEAQYGLIVTAFQTAYALGLLGIGRFIDKVGTRLGYSAAIAWWSLATMAHGAVASATGFGTMRFLLGLGEAGNFPAAIKTVAEWFPKSERALATGIFNSGSNVGAILVPLVAPWLVAHFGWRTAFVALGAAGFLWIVAWLAVYRKPDEHPRVSKAELDWILSDPAEPATAIPWRSLIANPAVLGLTIGRFLTDPVWWFYLYWAPKFLNAQFGFKLDQLGLPVALMYLFGNAGGIFGGWLSAFFIRRGAAHATARKRAMLVCALMVVPIVYASRTRDPWTAIALIALAMAAHQGWAANVFTLVSDLFPKHVVSSIVGVNGFGGAVGGMLVASAVGFILQATGSYVLIFGLAGGMYLVAIAIVHWFTRGPLAAPRTDAGT